VPTAQNSVLINKQLQKLGFGTLKDPNLFAQMAMVIRDHQHFRRLLMAVEPSQRHVAYEALASKLRFTAKPLEDYEIESRTLAEQNKLPHYDPKSLAVTEWKPQEITLNPKTDASTSTAASDASSETRLSKVAEEAIDRDLREASATQECTLVCIHCTREQKFRVKKRSAMPKVARQYGWTFPTRDKALCMACSSN
jgi:hypothetical protein